MASRWYLSAQEPWTRGVGHRKHHRGKGEKEMKLIEIKEE